MLEIHLFLHLEFYLWSYGDWNCVTVRTSRNKYADAAHRNTNHCANFSSNVWDLLIFLSHLAVSPLPTVHVSFTSCLALYTLPPVRPFLWPAPWIMSLSLRAWNFKLLPVKATIFENVSVKFKLCLIVKSKECTSDSRYTPIFMHTHTRFKRWKMWWLWTCWEQQISRHCTTLWSHSHCCADRWSCWLTPALTL